MVEAGLREDVRAVDGGSVKDTVYGCPATRRDKLWAASRSLLAQRILDCVSGPVSTLIEPFAGSAAFTIVWCEATS